MKKITKVLTVALAVLMIMMTSVTAFADHAFMSLEETLTINQYGGDLTTYMFEAPKEGWYVLSTYTSDEYTDPYVYIRDSDGYELASCDDSVFGSYNSEAWFYAEKGENYYITFSNYNDERVTFTAWLEAENENSHIYCIDNYEYTDGYCDFCGCEIYVYDELPLDDYAIFYQDACEEEAFEFTADEDGWYVLSTFTYDEETDPYIYVVDSYGDIVGSCDDSAYGSLNGEAWFYANEGETYTICVGNYNDYYGVNFEVYFEKEGDYSHMYCVDFNDGDGYCDWCGYEICGHRCHDNGFFWRIANFFNRVFRINERCECGVYHW